MRSLSARRAWIEIWVTPLSIVDTPSLSARRAWIEIAPCSTCSSQWPVALRKESVDRNRAELDKRREYNVALRKESVDRNQCFILGSLNGWRSLSARRAWIEMGQAR